MAWISPKLDWLTNPVNPTATDMARIEGNTDFLKTDIETKKGDIVDALNGIGITASLSDTHADLAIKISGIDTQPATLYSINSLDYLNWEKSFFDCYTTPTSVISISSSAISIKAGSYSGDYATVVCSTPIDFTDVRSVIIISNSSSESSVDYGVSTIKYSNTDVNATFESKLTLAIKNNSVPTGLQARVYDVSSLSGEYYLYVGARGSSTTVINYVQLIK